MLFYYFIEIRALYVVKEGGTCAQWFEKQE